MYSAAGIYLGYVGFQNLGDEAILEVCRRQFSSIRWTSTDATAYTSDWRRFAGKVRRDGRYLSRWISEEVRHQSHLRLFADKMAFRLAAMRGGQVAMLGGGTLVNSSDAYLKAYRELRDKTGQPVPVFGSGVVSPEFMATVRGWRDRRSEWVVALSTLPIVGVRGPISKQLLDEAGAENVIVSGDPAVMFHTPLRRIRSTGPPNRKSRIGINCGRSRGHFWGNEERIGATLATVAQVLTKSGHEVQLFAVCPEDLDSCNQVAQKAGFSEAVIAPLLSSPESFLKRASEWDCLVAVKLHAGVLAAAANLPFVSLAYQPKCLDFAASIGWQDFTVRTDVAHADTILDLVACVLSTSFQIEERLCKAMCQLSSQFESYCQRIKSLLLPSKEGIS